MRIPLSDPEGPTLLDVAPPKARKAILLVFRRWLEMKEAERKAAEEANRDASGE